MKRPVTEADLIADPSLASIGVKVGDEYDFDDPAPKADERVPMFDPFTGKPLAQVSEEIAKPAEEPKTDIVDSPAEEVDKDESDVNVEEHEQKSDSQESEESPASQSDKTEAEPVKDPLTYADILERGISLNKVEAANLHPGISNIAQWGDIVIRQSFKPEK